MNKKVSLSTFFALLAIASPVIAGGDELEEVSCRIVHNITKDKYVCHLDNDQGGSFMGVTTELYSSQRLKAFFNVASAMGKTRRIKPKNNINLDEAQSLKFINEFKQILDKSNQSEGSSTSTSSDNVKLKAEDNKKK